MYLVPSNVFTDAVRAFWGTRISQADAKVARGVTDQGTCGAVTGGGHLHGFARTIITLLVNAGVRPEYIYAARASLPTNVVARNIVTLPGFYRSTKDWDLVVVANGDLVAAIELKSQVGSFGNNVNNRIEEAIGTATDLWTAYREGAFGSSATPWLGYLFVLEDCEASRRPVATGAHHFTIFPEFVGASYADRYELLCRKLVRERLYSAACFLMADRAQAEASPNYSERASELSGERFLTQLLAHVSAYT